MTRWVTTELALSFMSRPGAGTLMLTEKRDTTDT